MVSLRGWRWGRVHVTAHVGDSESRARVAAWRPSASPSPPTTPAAPTRNDIALIARTATTCLGECLRAICIYVYADAPFPPADRATNTAVSRTHSTRSGRASRNGQHRRSRHYRAVSTSSLARSLYRRVKGPVAALSTTFPPRKPSTLPTKCLGSTAGAAPYGTLQLIS